MWYVVMKMEVSVLMNCARLPVTVYYISCFRGSRYNIFPDITNTSRNDRAACEQRRRVDEGGGIVRSRSGRGDLYALSSPDP